MRIRIGVGNPQHKDYDLADYVLGRFGKEEIPVLEEAIKKEKERINKLIDMEIEKRLYEKKEVWVNMSEEEKITIEELSIKAITSPIEAPNFPNMICMKKDMLIVLNLIEKQNKRIEELKFENILAREENDYLHKNYIPKSVIREKIEELEEMLPNQYVHIDYTKKMLKELLGGSNE